MLRAVYGPDENSTGDGGVRHASPRLLAWWGKLVHQVLIAEAEGRSHEYDDDGQDPDRLKQWLTFLRNHRDVIAAMDFFTVPTVSLQALYAFFEIEFGRRRVGGLHHRYEWREAA